MTDEELRKLQLVELDMLKEVDRICRKHNIQYSLYGGTTLGAVRHKGFIPWDDDADVVFSPDEYERFYRACKADLNTDLYFLQERRTDEHYRWGYAKLRRNNSVYARVGQENMKWHNGIFIDIFVLYNVPDSALLRPIYNFSFFLIRKILYSKVGKFSEKNQIKRSFFNLLSAIPRDSVFKIADKIVWKKDSELVNQMYYPNSRRCKYGIPARCVKNSVELTFEDQNFMVMEGYDEVLSSAFGNYMEYPPLEDRVGHNPASIIVFPD